MSDGQRDAPKGTQTWAVLATIGMLSRALLEGATLALLFFAVRLVPDWAVRAEHGDPVAGVVAVSLVAGGGLTFVAGVFAAVAFLIWLSRSVRLAGSRGLLPPSSRSRAVVSWFIPFVNIVVPYHVVRSLHRVSAREAPRAPRDLVARWPQIFPVWWFAWLGMILLNRVSAAKWWNAEAVLAVDWLDGLELVCTLVAAAGAAAILWSIQRAQSAVVVESTVPQFVPPVGAAAGDGAESEGDADDDDDDD